nr:protein like COV 3-like [Tanacetum cinerariifolium]
MKDLGEEKKILDAIGWPLQAVVDGLPDIAYAVSIVSRYLANLGKNHWEAVKWILKYLLGIVNVGLVYGTNHGNHMDVTGFVDSNYAKDPDKEAEYIALTEAVKEAIWLRGLLEELGVVADQLLQLSLLSFIGLGFVTSITFIFLVGVFMSSWLGANLLTLGEFIIKKLPFMSYIYTASKQISVAISPGQGSNAFKEVAIIKHPSVGEYAIGFITSTLVLRKNLGDEELCCIYVPTNHLYMGDIVLVNSKDVMRPNISVREGIEIVISGGMSIPKLLTTTNSQDLHSPRVGKYVIPQV